LKPDGVLAVHVSNRYVDLEPIVGQGAKESGKEARIVSNPSDLIAGISGSTWVLVTSRPGFFEKEALKNAERVPVPADFQAWTDDYTNLWRVFRFR
jgi:hypothetical protein